jgi:metal-responsive CopG/Arc/MetJ family transcriptional regulator
MVRIFILLYDFNMNNRENGLMNRSNKVAISLPEHILIAVEKGRKASGESRSAFFRRAVEQLLQKEQDSQDIERYIQGYGAMPESVEEIETINRVGAAVLAQEPW